SASDRKALQVSRMILEPVRALLGKKRLVIVGDGALQYIPFAALADPAQAKYQPLISAHEIVNAPSASTLALLRRGTSNKPAAGPTIAVFADPVFERDDPRLRAGSQVNSSGPAPAFLTRAAELHLGRLPSSRIE